MSFKYSWADEEADKLFTEYVPSAYEALALGWVKDAILRAFIVGANRAAPGWEAKVKEALTQRDDARSEVGKLRSLVDHCHRELVEHNSDYHYRTPDSFLQSLIDATGVVPRLDRASLPRKTTLIEERNNALSQVQDLQRQLAKTEAMLSDAVLKGVALQDQVEGLRWDWGIVDGERG